MRRVSLVLLCFALLVLVVSGASSAAPSAKFAITPAPAFTADQMNAPPADNWLSNMGNLAGTRYSSLTQVTPANVSTLKEAWHIHLGTCVTKDAACGSLEANAAVYAGTYYIQTPKSDVFALDGATGAVLWHYVPVYPAGFNVGTGGRQPGVAIADGKVFAPRRDGTMVALDQMLGGEIWKVELLPWQKGGRVSDAPIYANGIIISGDSGGDGGSPSNSMQAFDATTGARLWQWTVIPRLGQPGSNTWPAEAVSGKSSSYGGGALWESPIVDTKNSLVIFGTGNTEPWNSRGPGMNLWTDSIVALNLYTGQLVWGYQTTHHDEWDSDLPNNGVMFDAPFKVSEKYKAKVPYTVKVRRHGKLVKVKKFKLVTKTRTVTKTQPGVAYVNKYGWTFVLNRLTGKPLLPIKEVKIPVTPAASAPDVNPWPTQPIPQNEDFVTDDVMSTDGSGRNCSDGTQTQTNFYVPFGTATDPILQKPFKIGCVYDPYDTTQQVVTPFEEMDWPASSYSPENHTMITCGVSKRSRGFLQIPKASQTVGANGGTGAAIQGTGDTSTSNWGNFTALDVTTGRYSKGVGWHQRWDAPCYSGSMNTASGLTFIGHLGQQANGQDGKGYLEAVDTKTGASLWKSAAMDAPVGAAPVTYTVNGKQYISVAVGGESHNDVSRPFGLTDPRRLRNDSIYTFVLP
jgi:alcohol dehydrogenase (cytochrome c)